MTIEQQIFNARIDAALNEVLTDMDARDAEIEERKQVFIQQALQVELVKMLREAA